MNRPTVARWLAALSLALTAGCMTRSEALRADPSATPRAPTPLSHVILYQGTPERPFRVVGKVHTHCRWDWLVGGWAATRHVSYRRLRREASRLGADAVIQISKDRRWQFEWTDTHFRGVAVVWREAQDLPLAPAPIPPAPGGDGPAPGAAAGRSP